MKNIQTANLLALRGDTILLVKRSDDQEQGGMWSLPGGTRHSGEKITDTLLREIEEELGVSVSAYELFKKYVSEGPGKVVEAYYFVGGIDTANINLDKTELSAYKWFPFRDIPKDLAYSQNKIITDFLN